MRDFTVRRLSGVFAGKFSAPGDGEAGDLGIRSRAIPWADSEESPDDRAREVIPASRRHPAHSHPTAYLPRHPINRWIAGLFPGKTR